MVENIVTFIKKGRLRWLGHVDRMEEVFVYSMVNSVVLTGAEDLACVG